MPDVLTIAVVTTATTAALSGLTTYFGMKSKILNDLLAQYDKDLRDRRLRAYGALWTLSEPLARFSPIEPLTGAGARTVSQGMRGWYFRDGIVLSEAAREAYFSLQEALLKPRVAAAAATPLDRDTLGGLWKASRDLHTALCVDIGSRKPPMIGFKASKKERPSAGDEEGRAAARGIAPLEHGQSG
jgi:hypothetical protein